MSAGLAQLVRRVAVLVAIPTLPGLALVVFGYPGVSTVWTLGAVAGLLAVLAAGPRTAMLTALATAAGAAVASAVAGSPLGAALVMAVVAAAAGLTSLRGLSGALLLAPVTVGFVVAQPPQALLDVESRPLVALTVGAATLLAVTWGAGVGSLLGSRIHLPTAVPARPRRAVTYAVILAVVVGTGAWIVVQQGLGHGGAWLLLTLLIVVQPYGGDTFTKSLQRGAGTAVGFVIALVIGTAIPWPGVQYATGAVLLAVAIVIRVRGRTYWHYVLVLTPAVVLMDSTGSTVLDTDLQRLAYTWIGVGVALGVAALQFAVHRRGEPLHAPTPARTAPRGTDHRRQEKP